VTDSPVIESLFVEDVPPNEDHREVVLRNIRDRTFAQTSFVPRLRTGERAEVTELCYKKCIDMVKMIV
jgi:hypothetical protein